MMISVQFLERVQRKLKKGILNGRMKSSFFLLTILIALSAHVQGQPTFQKYYYGFGTYGHDLYELSSGNLMAGMAYQSGTSILDSEGNVLHSHCYEIQPLLVIQSIRKIADNKFLINGGYGVPNVEINPAIGTIDSLGNINWMSSYTLTNPGLSKAASGDIEITNDYGAIVTSRAPAVDSFFILKIDSIGEPVWCKDFGQGGYFQFVKELPSGDLLVGMNMDPGGAAVARMDASGNIIWLRSYIRPEGVVRDCRVENDSSFTVIGYTDRDNGSGTRLFMLRLNGIGDVQWCKGYDAPSGWYTARAKMEETIDGNYVVLAGIVGQGGGKAFLMKANMSGDTLWTRAAGVTSNHYEVYNLLAHSDGGFLFNGQGWGLGTFLFKADSLGHLPCPEHEHQYTVQVQNLFPTDSSFTLTSIDGAIRHPAYVNDTIYPPVTVIDGCTITQIPNYALKRPPPRIRPNPTTGRFTMDFVDPLRADSFYSVYDSMGKLLYQRPLPSGATTEEVDLARFGKGIYLVKITDPESVRTERVVVE